MKVLILDDKPPYPNSVWIPRLRDAGHETLLVRKMFKAVELLRHDRSFTLVVIDILMDHDAPAELSAEQLLVSAALRSAGHPGETTAQALGLWLWEQRRPYCYLTSYRTLWMPGLSQPPEFDGASDAELRRLVCDRGTEGRPDHFVAEIEHLWAVKMAGQWAVGGQP